jgi:transposase
MLPKIQSNAEFRDVYERDVYEYFTTRRKNSLKGNQTIIAAACKLIRVFYAILKRGVDYDPQKLRTDIIHPMLAAA